MGFRYAMISDVTLSVLYITRYNPLPLPVRALTTPV